MSDPLLAISCLVALIGVPIGVWLVMRDLRKQRGDEASRVAGLELARQVREDSIMARKGEWGEEMCRLIIDRKLALDMTPEMVIAAWGDPSTIDQKEISKTGVNKERWVYGTPRSKSGARYIHFTKGKVAKIKTS